MTTATTHPLTADQSVTIRPIRPSDDAMEGEFIRNLSMETKHYRFLGEYPGAGAGELAVTIADAWQNKGLGQLLLKQLIAYAKTHGLKQLYSVELADNTAMRDLATELGMSVRCDPDDANQVIYSVTL